MLEQINDKCRHLRSRPKQTWSKAKSEEYGLNIHTDDSEQNEKAEFIVTNEGEKLHKSGRRLEDNMSIFQADVSAVQETLKLLTTLN